MGMHLHTNIRALRRHLNMSQEELATRIGLNRGNIASYENGSAEPRICNLVKLSQLFGVPIVDLIVKDLTLEETLDLARLAAENHSSPFLEKEILDEFAREGEKLEELFKSLRTCCHFHQSSRDQLSKDAQVLLLYFDQLFEAANGLLCNHQALLKMIQKGPENEQ